MQRDLTRNVLYQTSPAGIIRVDDNGLISPLANGTATLTASSKEGVKTTLQVKVEKFGDLKGLIPSKSKKD